MKDPYTSEGEVSEWNEALLKMKRLHELQTEINRCSITPLTKHVLVNEYNYVIWFKSLCALYAEGNSKYKKDEIDVVNELKETIEKMMEDIPIVESGKDASGKKFSNTSKKNWKILKSLIEEMEFKVRYYNDQHGLSTKNKESMDGRSILR